MSLSVEFQLLMLAVGLYVFDSTLLLYPNEGVLTLIGKDKWRIMFGSDNTRVRGKEVLFPNLLLPHRPVFKLSWEYEGAKLDASAVDWKVQKTLFKELALPVYLIGIAQFIMFPYVIFFYLTDLSIICSLVFLYLSILLSLFLVYRKRDSFYISKSKFFSISFECLVCPPVAFNLVRKLSLSLPEIKEDLLMVSKILLEPEIWRDAKGQFISRIIEEINFEEEGTSRFANLNANLDNLLNEPGK